MSRYLQVEPAYGVKLNSLAAVKKHYDDNKDFRILTFGPEMGRYINKQDVDGLATDLKLEVRYGKQGEKVTVLP